MLLLNLAPCRPIRNGLDRAEAVAVFRDPHTPTMPVGLTAQIVSTWPGSLLLLAFVLVCIHGSGLALNWVLGLGTRGIASVAYSAAAGCVVLAALGVAVCASGGHRHLVATVSLISVLVASVVILVRNRIVQLVYGQLDSGDRVALGIYVAFLCFCCGITYLPINFPANMPDGPYIFKSRTTNVKIQVMTGNLPVDNYLPHVVSEYMLRGISFREQHPVLPGQEVSDRPVLMSLVVVPFRSVLDQPEMQQGQMPRFQYVGQSWPDVSIFSGDSIYRQFLVVGIFLNGLLILGAAMILKGYGNSIIQVTGCLLIFFNPYFISETIFTWPKSMAAFFALLAIYSVEYLETRPHIVAGILSGLAYLSHPSAVFYAGSLLLFLGYQAAVRKTSYLKLLNYLAAFAFTICPWFLWRLYLRLPSDLMQQNIGLHNSLVETLWVRLHNAYETLGGRMFEAYPFNADQFIDLTILCLPGAVGLLFIAYAYREIIETFRVRPLLPTFGVLVPAIAIIAVFGYPAAVPALHGLQAASVLLILVALMRLVRRVPKLTLFVMVAAQLALNGSLLYLRASSLGVFALTAQHWKTGASEGIAGASKAVALIGWPSTIVRNATIAPNLNVPITIANVVKSSIWLNPRGEVVFSDVKLGANPAFAVSVGIHPAVWTETTADGATFEADVSDGNQTVVAFRQFINPVHVPADRGWKEIRSDLSRFRNETVTITIKSLPGPSGSDYAEWCLWGDPRIVDGTGTR